MVRIRSGPHSKLKADQNSAHLPGYSIKNRLETVISPQPVQGQGFPHASQNGICGPEMRICHIIIIIIIIVIVIIIIIIIAQKQTFLRVNIN